MSTIHDERRARLVDAMRQAGAETLVICGNAWQNDYLRYVTDHGVLEGDAIAIVHADGEAELLVEGPLEADRARAAKVTASVTATADLVETARTRLARIANRATLAGPASLLPYGLSPAGGQAEIGDATALLDRLLMFKSPAEIAAMRQATELADRGYQVFLEAARIGRAEYEIVADIERYFRSQGSADNFMLIGSGGQELKGMTPAGERRLARGDLVITELSPSVDGYYSQICRTLVLGPPTPAQRDAFAVYQEAVAAGLAVLRAGVKACDVARAENDVFRKHGLAEYTTAEYTRVRGHGLGLFVDTKPHILEDVETVLEAGATVIVHPNTYHPVAGYMVLGDVTLVTDRGYEDFGTTPRELMVSNG